MPSDECPCPNTWVCALIFYFRMETVGGDSGDCQASCHRVRCEVWGVRWWLQRKISSWAGLTEDDRRSSCSKEVSHSECPTQVSTWPIILPLISIFSLRTASVPPLCVLSDTISSLTAWWLVWSYYKAIPTPTPPPPPVKSGYPLTSNLSLEPTDWSSQYLRKEGWRRSVSRAVFLPARNHIWIKSYRADS